MDPTTRAEMARFCELAWAPLVSAMTYRCGDVHQAEEVVQEALLRACARWSHVSGMASPQGWVYRVAVNLASSTWRRRAIERRANRQHHAQTGQMGTDSLPEDDGIFAAALSLPPKQRDCVVLRHVLDLSVAQTAEVLGMSAEAVRAGTHRGLDSLRQQLAPTGTREVRHER